MKRLLVAFCIVVMSIAAYASIRDVLPQYSVRGTNNTVYASYSYGCSGAWRDELTFDVFLDKPSRGTTVVRLQLDLGNDKYLKKTVEIANRKESVRVKVSIGAGNCATIRILDAYIK